ncbi:N-acetylglucosamine-6-phosphate deacetylase [Prosthecobacter sp.]|uniref:N-acetylglucosamine-6-phosphate deacetylase n=1 Tax=Prosthecobacter sp. TaxID=1965333 RepID=UPI0037837669
MKSLVIHNVTAILEDKLLPNACVTVREGRIAEISASAKRMPKDTMVVDGQGGYLSPGFVDVHVHGGGGGDFMDGTADAARVACQTHFRHGTTTIFPTTTTGQPEEIHAMIQACQTVGKETEGGGLPRIPGIHLYGPFFAADKVGAHPAAGRRNPTPEEFRTYFKTGFIRIATCAAELPGAAAFYQMAKRNGCFITCGHSNASWSEMDRAFRSGMRHVDHFWCAMSDVSSVRGRLGTPMQGSMEQYVLFNPGMSTEVIADGQHLSPELLLFAHRMIGPKRLLLVTDSSRAVDMPVGKYKIGNIHTGNDITHDGKVSRTATGLGSSSVGMDHMVRTMKTCSGAPLWEVIRMASLTPAERLGIDDEVGSLKKGKRADLVLFSKTLRVKKVWLGDNSPL